MSIQLFRIDDRLIHGQVVIGWAGYLHSKRIILCDDSVYENEWEKELYMSIVPDYIEAQILSIDKTAELLKNPNTDLSKTIILVKSPDAIEALLLQGVRLTKINVGGLHFQEGRKKYLPYIFLAKTEIDSFTRLMRGGIHFDCLDVPKGKSIALEKIINQKTS